MQGGREPRLQLAQLAGMWGGNGIRPWGTNWQPSADSQGTLGAGLWLSLPCHCPVALWPTAPGSFSLSPRPQLFCFVLGHPARPILLSEVWTAGPFLPPPQALPLVSSHTCTGQDTLGCAQLVTTGQGSGSLVTVHLSTDPSPPLSALVAEAMSEGRSQQDPGWGGMKRDL